MADIGYTEAGERIDLENRPEPRETAVGASSQWGAFAKFLIFRGQRLLYSALVLPALDVSSSGGLRLAEIFETAAKQNGVKLLRAEEEIDIS